MTGILGVLAGALILAAAVAVWWYRTGLLRERTRRRVLVTLRGGEAFAGVLYATDRDCLVLREASAMAYGPRQENVIVEGEVVLLRSEITYLQFP